MDRSLIAAGLLSVLFASASMASSLPIVVNVGAGLGLSSMSSSAQNVNIGDGIENRYINSSHHRFSYLVNAGVALKQTINNALNLDYGVSVYRMQQSDLSGTVIPGYSFNPDNDQLNFHYKIKPSILVMAQATLHWKKDWSALKLNPYVMLAAGIARNKVENYSESVPSGSSAAPMVHPYRNNSNTQFAFSLGLGVSHNFGTNRLSVGYQYVYAGHGQFLQPVNKASNMRLKTPALQGHYIFVNYTFSV